MDTPDAASLRQETIRRKPFLCAVYREWYSILAGALPAGGGPILEIGSRTGFLEECIPGLITSDIAACARARLVCDGQRLPLADETLRGIVMTNVMHHFPSPKRFFTEAHRCLRPGGIVAAVEPWITPWSRLFYEHLHSEPCLTRAREWEFASSGPMSGANLALPWIIFHRDRQVFEKAFPGLRVKTVEPITPFCYVLSGGVSKPGLVPGWSYGFWKALEKACRPWKRTLAMFAAIVIEKV